MSALAALMLHLDIYADIFDEDSDRVADRPGAASQATAEGFESPCGRSALTCSNQVELRGFESVLDLRKWPLNCTSMCSSGVTQVLSVLVICLRVLRDVTSLAESDPAKPSPA